MHHHGRQLVEVHFWWPHYFNWYRLCGPRVHPKHRATCQHEVRKIKHEIGDIKLTISRDADAGWGAEQV